MLEVGVRFTALTQSHVLLLLSPPAGLHATASVSQVPTAPSELTVVEQRKHRMLSGVKCYAKKIKQ